MIDTNFLIPLSPPSSPHMAELDSNPTGLEWKSAQSNTCESVEGSEDNNLAMLHHESFPYPLKTSGFPFQNGNSIEHPGNSPIPHERISISKIEDEMSPTEIPPVTFGASAPASPVSQLTPPSLSGEKELGDFDIEEQIKEEQEQKPGLSAAEIRAQKRKMKRFRLTHNQTRFLMSEFARQAHPDAAHRERLAREIPGLSARQVQVWFQNRRAKLKRLTTDDQERMMKSRALPEDFDMTQALHSPFGTTQPMSNSLTSPVGFAPSFSEGSMPRALSLDTLRRLPEGAHMSPTGISPAFGAFAFTPPQSATDTLSPVSATSETSPFSFQSPSLENHHDRSGPFIGASPTATAYPIPPQVPRLQIHDRMRRAGLEPTSSPLRTSMSYSQLHDGGFSRPLDSPTDSVCSSQMGEPHSTPRSLINSGLPYGLGNNYNQISGFQASVVNRVRSFSCAVPRRIELSSLYTSNARSTSTPQTATFPNYSSAGSSPLGSFGPTSPSLGIHPLHAPLNSAPHNLASFQNPYFPHDDGASTPGSVNGSHHDQHAQFTSMPSGAISGVKQEDHVSLVGSPVGGPDEDSAVARDGLQISTSAF